jgi:hypothetical protein
MSGIGEGFVSTSNTGMVGVRGSGISSRQRPTQRQVRQEQDTKCFHGGLLSLAKGKEKLDGQ